MSWPEWNLALPQEIARFVNPKEAVRSGLRPRTAGDLRNDPEALAAAIYEGLRERGLGYTSTVLGEHGNQTIQTPQHVLEHGTPNCTDLTTLYAAACLASELIPVIALITKADNTRHALVLVVPNADPRARKTTDLGRIGGIGHVSRRGGEEVGELLAVIDAQAWIPVETTGITTSTMWAGHAGQANQAADVVSDPAARSLEFEQATNVAREVLRGTTRIDLVDVHRLQSDGMHPWVPPELEAAEDAERAEAERLLDQRRRRRNMLAAGVGVAALAIAAVVWAPWSGGERERMTGGFNVAVAGLQAGNSDLERDAKTVPQHLSAELGASYDGDPRFLVWGPDDVGTVATEEAEAVSADIGADVLVFGTLAIDGALDDVYGVDLRVHSAQHAARAPWPMAVDEQVELTVPVADVTAGVLETNASVVTFTRTLDGLAALLADEYAVASDRLAAAQAAAGDGSGPSLIPALRAWSLLVQAGFEGDDSLVTEAAALADEALRREPDSEFARIVSVSVEYLSAIPAQANTVQVACAVEPNTERPDPADLAALRQRIVSMLPDASDIGVIQLTAILGRLEIAEAVSRFADGDELDLTNADSRFLDIIDASGDDRSLRIWAADAHRFRGLISQVDPTRSLDVTIGHLIDAARISTPIWQSRTFGLAGRAQRCSTDGSAAEATCYFELAIRNAPSDEATLYREAIADLGAACPDGWELP